MIVHSRNQRFSVSIDYQPVLYTLCFFKSIFLLFPKKRQHYRIMCNCIVIWKFRVSGGQCDSDFDADDVNSDITVFILRDLFP